MKQIEKKDQLIKNIKTLDSYLTNEKTFEQNETLALIKRGTCFVAYKNNEQMRFAPSRFIGYVDNRLDQHIESKTKHGGETNQAISRILKSKPLPNEELNNTYIEYCNFLGVKASATGSFGSERKFWILDEK